MAPRRLPQSGFYARAASPIGTKCLLFGREASAIPRPKGAGGGSAYDIAAGMSRRECGVLEWLPMGVPRKVTICSREK